VHGNRQKALWEESDTWKWNWDDCITLHGHSVRLTLCGMGVTDADLEDLTRHVSAKLTNLTGRGSGEYDLTIDLSCNPGISDEGIAVHLVPFLERWPTCRRLKLYQTSIGDRGVNALSAWVAGGQAHEIHLSDLGGPTSLSRETVLALLREIHSRKQYPYSVNGGQAALWLRLEHNGIQDTDQLVAELQAEGMAVHVVNKTELSRVRPGIGYGGSTDAVNLVLFHMQQQLRKATSHQHGAADLAWQHREQHRQTT
jgi:hypothetical protein